MLAISIENLTKIIKNKKAVDSLSLNVSEGSIFGFLGPNGAGKTTTIKMLLKLIRPNAGVMKILGFDINSDYQKVSKQIAAVMETPTFFPQLNALQTLQTFSDYCGLSKSKIELEELLDKCGILYASKKNVVNFSLGMKQRLAIAVALINSPKVIFLDEPTNGLDPEGIIKIRKLIRQLAEEEKRTVFVSSHLLAEVEKMCDEVGILNKGRLLAVGRVHDLLFADGVTLKVMPRNIALETIEVFFPEVEIKKSASDKTLFLKINPIRIPQVIEKLVEKKVEIHEVVRNSQTLEDFFHEIVERNS